MLKFLTSILCLPSLILPLIACTSTSDLNKYWNQITSLVSLKNATALLTSVQSNKQDEQLTPEQLGIQPITTSNEIEILYFLNKVEHQIITVKTIIYEQKYQDIRNSKLIFVVPYDLPYAYYRALNPDNITTFRSKPYPQLVDVKKYSKQKNDLVNIKPTFFQQGKLKIQTDIAAPQDIKAPQTIHALTNNLQLHAQIYSLQITGLLISLLQQELTNDQALSVARAFYLAFVANKTQIINAKVLFYVLNQNPNLTTEQINNLRAKLSLAKTFQ